MFHRSIIATVLHVGYADYVASQVDLNVNAKTANNENDDKTPPVREDIAEICRLCGNPAPTCAYRAIVALKECNRTCPGCQQTYLLMEVIALWLTY
jgi:MinD superfamily P-loop ATPase